MPGMTATYSHGGPEWDDKLRKAVTRLDQAFRLSYGLSYERKAVAVGKTGQNSLILVVSRLGLEPRALALKGRCSTV